jgi:hypothetical protein
MDPLASWRRAMLAVAHVHALAVAQFQSSPEPGVRSRHETDGNERMQAQGRQQPSRYPASTRTNEPERSHAYIVYQGFCGRPQSRK